MNKTAKYFIDLIKDKIMYPEYGYLCIKNFKIDSFSHIYWDEADNPPKNAKTASIIGVSCTNSDVFFGYFNVSPQDMPLRRSYSFQNSWLHWGTFVFNIDSIEDGTVSAFLENAFLQLMHEVENGNNVFIGKNHLFIKKNTAYQHMMKIDLLDIE